MKHLTVTELGNLTASKDPVPGGGSIAAVCGSLSGALAEMVANLTIGKKKYIDVKDQMKDIASKACNLRLSLLDDIEKDSQAFSLVMDAFAMPKERHEEKVARSLAIQEGLKAASLTPYHVASKALDVERLAARVVAQGNKNAITDGLVATMLARTAVLSAALNVKINLDSIKDDDFVEDMKAKVIELEKEALQLEMEVLTEYSL